MESTTLTRPREERGVLGRLRAAPARAWERTGLAVLALGAAIAYAVYPTYPVYDSAYELVWGRSVLHGHLPDFDAYRAPTEHPLGLLAGTVAALFGEAAPRLWMIATIAAYCLLVAGLYRLGCATFGRWVGLVAALLLLSRLNYAFLAARGYLDIPYLALIAWAAALEAERPRRGGRVWVLLGLAGLLRPEGWLLIAAYWLWCAVADQPWRRRLQTAAYAAVAPVLWALTDLIVTGSPSFSLHHTSSLASDLDRSRPASQAPSLFIDYLETLMRVPLLAAAVVGLALALVLARRRARVALAVSASGAITFGLIAVAGLSVIERYLSVTALVLLVFSAYAIVGFTTLARGAALRRPWAGLALVCALAGGAYTVGHLHPGSINRDMTNRRRLHDELSRLVKTPAFAQARRCGAVTVPNHKLIPDVRWMLGAERGVVIARSALPDAGQDRRGAAVFVAGTAMLTNSTYGPFVAPAHDSPLIQVPGTGARRIAGPPEFRDFVAYATC
jgi:hypothetical protein